MQTIYLDISNRGVVPVIYAKQNDVGRKIEVVLTNSGLPYEPEAGSAFSAWYSGASGMGNYTDIGGKSAFSVSGNKVTVELIAQMLQNGGEGFLCLVLSRAGGEQIGLWNIRYICEGIPGAGSEGAQQYYTAFSQAVSGLAYPDASLSVAGKAADAAAVGTALAGKAPATESTDHPGCYYRIVDGVTEWVNPPLVLFEEYHTTERWQGKVVYTMLFDIGAMPASKAAKQVSLPDGLNPGQIIRCEGSCAADVAETFPAYSEGPIIFFARQDNVRCENWSSWNMSYFGAKVQIWYTKD